VNSIQTPIPHQTQKSGEGTPEKRMWVTLSISAMSSSPPPVQEKVWNISETGQIDEETGKLHYFKEY
jgi:hypothetical protein